MGFGIPPSFMKEIGLVGSMQNACQTVVETFEVLGWRFFAGRTRRISRQNKGKRGKSAETFIPVAATVSSKCGYPQMFDWGKNEQNVNEFAGRFAIKEIRNAKLIEGREQFLDEKGANPPVANLTKPRTVMFRRISASRALPVYLRKSFAFPTARQISLRLCRH